MMVFKSIIYPISSNTYIFYFIRTTLISFLASYHIKDIRIQFLIISKIIFINILYTIWPIP